MSVAKVIEVTAQSSEGFEAAAAEGIRRANKTVHNIESAWIKEQHLAVKDGEVVAYRVTLKITFLLDG